MRNAHIFKLRVRKIWMKQIRMKQIRFNQGVEKSNVILENIRKSKLTVDFELTIFV